MRIPLVFIPILYAGFGGVSINKSKSLFKFVLEFIQFHNYNSLVVLYEDLRELKNISIY